MDLLPEEIKEFKDITFRLYKRTLTDDEAKDQLNRMVLAFEMIQKNPIANVQKEGQND